MEDSINLLRQAQPQLKSSQVIIPIPLAPIRPPHHPPDQTSSEVASKAQSQPSLPGLVLIPNPPARTHPPYRAD